jgi:hypothetical protein
MSGSDWHRESTVCIEMDTELSDEDVDTEKKEKDMGSSVFMYLSSLHSCPVGSIGS